MAATVRGTFTLIDRASGTLKNISKNALVADLAVKNLGASLDSVGSSESMRKLDHASRKMKEFGAASRAMATETERSTKATARHFESMAVKSTAAIEEIKVRLHSLGRQKARPEIEMGGFSAFMVESELLIRQMKRMDRAAILSSLKASFSALMTSMTASAKATFGSLVRLAEGMGQKLAAPAKALTGVLGGVATGVMGVVANMNFLVIAIALAAAAIVPLVGALGALTGSLAAATAGIGAFLTGGLGIGVVGLAALASIAIPATMRLIKLKEAQNEYTKAVKASGKGSKEAAAAQKILSEAQKGTGGFNFADVSKLGSSFTKITRPGQAAFFGALNSTLEFAKENMREFGGIANRVGRATRDAWRDFLELFQKSIGRGVLKDLGKAFSASMGPLARAMGYVAAALGDIAVAASPHVLSFFKQLESWAKSWSRVWSKPDEANKRMGKMMGHLSSWLSFLDAIWKLIKAIFSPAADVGKNLLDDMTSSIKKLTDKIAKDPESVKRWFKKAADDATKLWNAFEDIVSAATKLAEALLPVVLVLSDMVDKLDEMNLLVPVLAGALALLATGGGVAAAAGGAAIVRAAAAAAAAAAALGGRKPPTTVVPPGGAGPRRGDLKPPGTQPPKSIKPIKLGRLVRGGMKAGWAGLALLALEEIMGDKDKKGDAQREKKEKDYLDQFIKPKAKPKGPGVGASVAGGVNLVGAAAGAAAKMVTNANKVSAAQKRVGDSAGRTKTRVAAAWQGMNAVVVSVSGSVLSQTNALLRAFGAGAVQAPGAAAPDTKGQKGQRSAPKNALGGRLATFASGGRIPGTPKGDHIPLYGKGGMVGIADGGELVVNRHTESRVNNMLNRHGTSLGREVSGEGTPHSRPMAAGRRHGGPFGGFATGGRVYTASQFGGAGDPGTGSQGYKGDDLNRFPNSFAELGMGTAMGGLAYKQPITVSYKGKSITVLKRDIGGGGGGLDGKVRGPDLWYQAAQRIGLPGLANVMVNMGAGTGGGSGERVRAPRVTGSGSLARIAQGASTKLTAAANRLVDRNRPSDVGQVPAGAGGGNVSGLQPIVRRAIAWAQKHGWAGSVSSGFRTRAEQAALYASKGPRMAAAPGNSNHEKGLAIDITDPAGFGRAMQSAPANSRLYSRMSWEPWHYSTTGYNKGGRVPQWGGWHGRGGNMQVNKPTLLGVGESGAETVSIRPVGKGGGGMQVKVDIGTIHYSGKGEIKDAIKSEVSQAFSELSSEIDFGAGT